MKKFLVAAIIAASMIIPTTNAEARVRTCGGYELPQQGPALVECVFEFLGMESQASYAQYVAERESHYHPDAYNPSGCGGVYQHMIRYWRGRALAYLPEWRFPNKETVHWSNGLANVWVTARMVKDNGWGPWRL
jgi:hypothetical protein